jgi:predicted HTH domain antitoxin
MSLEISDDLVRASGLSEDELAQEIAVFLFQKERLTLAQAARLARQNRLQFQHLLASRQIPVHYDSADLEEDLKNLRTLGRI